mgnify:CR=1 FL=1
MNTTSIPKESLKNFSFLKEDVLNTDELKKIRAFNLDRAARLGNAYKGKVKIFFKAIDSITRSVETTVWASADDHEGRGPAPVRRQGPPLDADRRDRRRHRG